MNGDSPTDHNQKPSLAACRFHFDSLDIPQRARLAKTGSVIADDGKIGFGWRAVEFSRRNAATDSEATDSASKRILSSPPLAPGTR